MSTLLSQSSRPLWVWIVVIVVGSLCVVAGLALLVWCLALRRRSRLDDEFVSDEPAEKKLTLRRGRTVPATSYLSLTGSRFGMSSYTAEEGLQSPSVRSKSPFEWWANIRGRASRLSYVSHVSSSQYPSSPRTGSFYQRGDYSVSRGSLASKDGSVRATVTEIKVTRPQATLAVPSFKRSSRSFEPVNFSRAFNSQTQRSLAASRNQTLSRIEESTPRHSVFSMESFRTRKGSHGTVNDQGLAAADTHNSRPASGATFLNVPSVPFAHSHSSSVVNSSREVGVFHEQPTDSEQQLTRPSPSPSSSPYFSSSPMAPTFPEQIAGPYLESPRTRAHTQSQPHSIWESSMQQFPWLEDHHQQPEQHNDHALDDSSFQHREYLSRSDDDIEPNMEDQLQALPPHFVGSDTSRFQSQPDLVSAGFGLGLSVATDGKKGRVLRKKSLRRTELV